MSKRLKAVKVNFCHNLTQETQTNGALTITMQGWAHKTQRNFQELIYPNHLEHVSCWWKRLGHYHASSPLLLRYIVIVPSCSYREVDY